MTIGSSYVPSFEDVLSAARSGDHRAFEQLYRALQPRVHAFARVRSFADPEGLVNDVLVQAFTHLDRFEGSEPQFNAWVFRITRNKMVDAGRRQQRRPSEVALDAQVEASLRDDQDVEVAALDGDMSDTLLGYLDFLTKDQRDVLLLRIVGDLTIDGVADVLGKPSGAVKALQRRALRTLARRLSSGDRTSLARPHVAGG